MWHNITINWARWLAGELRSKDIKDIIICGDLFHYRDEIAVTTIQVTREVLDIFSDFNIVMLPGNHDAYYKDNSNITSLSILKGWPNINVIDKQQLVRYNNRDLLICPWGVTSEDLQKADIIFGHFEITSFKMNHFKTCTTGIRANDLLQHSPLIITGHFHHREHRNYSDGEIVYLGNPFEMDFGDINCDKGYYILDLQKSELEYTPNTKSPKHVKIKLSDLASEKSISPKYKKKIKGNIIRVNIDLHIMPNDAELVLRSISKNHPEHVDVEYSINFDNFGLTDEDHDLSGVDIMTAIKEFVDLLDIDNKPDVLSYVSELYKGVR